MRETGQRMKRLLAAVPDPGLRVKLRSALADILASQEPSPRTEEETSRPLSDVQGFLKNVITQAAFSIQVLDVNGLTTLVNRAFLRLFGFEREDQTVGVVNLLTDKAVRDTGLLPYLERAYRGEVVEIPTIESGTRGGKRIAMRVKAFPLFDEAGKVSNVVLMHEDITRERHLRARLVQAEKLCSLGEMMAGFAHELNSPLTGVIGFSQLLLLDPESDRAGIWREKIYDSAMRCHQLVKNLLMFARKQSPEKKMADLNDVIRAVLELRGFQLRMSGVAVETDLAEELPSTLLDTILIEQVFLNLINNADQAMLDKEEGKKILAIRTWVEGGTILAEFRDTGPGIPPENLDKVFDPFFTTKEVGRGTGLGLSVSYGIVKEHGGDIWLDSEPGRGTTVMVELPVVAGDGREAGARAEERERAKDLGKRVLVVDDEEGILALLSEVIEGEGYGVDTAMDGQEALIRVTKNEYAALLVDVCMPDFDGVSFYRRVVAAHPDWERRFIFITGNVLEEMESSIRENIGDRYLEKPFRLEKLRGLLRSVVEE